MIKKYNPVPLNTVFSRDKGMTDLMVRFDKAVVVGLLRWRNKAKTDEHTNLSYFGTQYSREK